ncbi:iron-containing alcohol dehydrogenase [Cytobacillus sp. FJAT-53684]|uniref:Iron-containing alcohol dehydrogenase n=1 Tax=Cytobacillus mangrovibacter TaxID=3299024 RepID=A0ABW6JWC0_9BACI
MFKLYCRLYQGTYRIASNFLPWRKPELIEGENSLSQLPKLIKTAGIHRVLIVTDQGISSLGLMDGLLKALGDEGLDYVVYDKTVPNPTIENIEEALELYKAHNCNGIIAFGGGSPMDCAKGVGARIARPKKSISQMKGQLKIRKPIPTLFAVPTTAGTGSEATVVAVVSNSQTHEKYAVNDMSLIPHYAVLDPLLTVQLPPPITSTTGMDALTHAIEAYIGRSNTEETKEFSQKAVKLIFDNIYEAYSNGANISARTNMQKAAYLAGIAFTRAYVGYVHAIAHTLGGFYSFPHGLANAIILPYVLEYYGKSVHAPLAELADLVGIGTSVDTNEQKAGMFIEAIKGLNTSMGIPNKVNGIMESDIPLMVERAFNEANPLYPVPRILSKEDLHSLYQLIKE